MAKADPWWFIQLTSFTAPALYTPALHCFSISCTATYFHSQKLSCTFLLNYSKQAILPRSIKNAIFTQPVLKLGGNYEDIQKSLQLLLMYLICCSDSRTFLCLSQGICHQFSSESQQGILNNTRLIVQKKVPFFPRFQWQSLKQHKETLCVRAPNQRRKKKKTKSKQKTAFPPTHFCCESKLSLSYGKHPGKYKNFPNQKIICPDHNSFLKKSIESSLAFTVYSIKNKKCLLTLFPRILWDGRRWSSLKGDCIRLSPGHHPQLCSTFYID